jgi:hypothetical protein
MAYVINDDTDVEITRYNEAADIKAYSGASVDNVRGAYVQHDPIRKVEGVFIDLPSGGKLRVGDRPVTPKQMAETDALKQAQTPDPIAEVSTSPIPANGRFPIESIMGAGDTAQMDDYLAAGYTEAEVQQYNQYLLGQNAPQNVPVKLTADQMAEYAKQPGAQMVMPRDTSIAENMQSGIYNTLDPNREKTGGVMDTVSSVLQDLIGKENLTPDMLDLISKEMTQFADFYVPGVGASMSVDEGTTMVDAGYSMMKNGLAQGDTRMAVSGLIDATLGSAVTALGVAEIVPMVKGLSEPAKKLLREASPATKNLLADMIGTSRAIAQGDKDMLMEIFQPAGTPRSLGAAAEGENPAFTIGPPSEKIGIAGLDPKYRVTVQGFMPEGTGKQSFVPQEMTPQNRNVSDERLTVLAQEFPDPLASPEQYAGMMARARNSVEVPAPPTWMIEHANDIDKWAGWFKALTPDQIKAADEGLAVQDKFRAAYADPTTGPELTGQLMFWSIMSRMLSAFPHESGFLELAQSADPYIRKALAGDWTDQTTAEWRNMVSSIIPLDSPGRSATSNANAFGETFLRKMSVKDESGKSALERLHDMIADVNMSSAQIRRGYYGLANQTGIGNKILSFALLVSGRNDVVILDRIQINRMWGGGEKIYDDIMKQFEGAQGLAQYEALERSLATRVGDMYDKVGRAADASVGRYHWESWVLLSGQVVSHPTLEAVVRAGTPNIKRNMPATASTPVTEGRFHTKYSGVSYEKLPSGGSRYIYSTSDGQPYQFTKPQLDAMFDEAFKKKSGVLPPDFPGVKAFEGGNIPWFEYKGVDRAKLDDLIRSAGKPAEK